MPRTPRRPRRTILAVDIGGTHVKAELLPGPARRYRFPSGARMTPGPMVRSLRRCLKGQRFDAVSIGYPGRVRYGKIFAEPTHLAPGWVGYDFERAFGKPTRVLNDAAMQALGSYQGGRMLFLGLGAGLGSALIVDGRLQPMELAHLPYKKGRSYEEYVGDVARRKLGRKRWEREVAAVIGLLASALEPDYVVVGGGNVRRLKRLPPGTRRGDNRNAFVGGLRLWDDVPALPPPRRGRPPHP